MAAADRDLQAAIAAGTFRTDLFYRLNVFPIEILPCGNEEKTFSCWSCTSSIVSQEKRERASLRLNSPKMLAAQEREMIEAALRYTGGRVFEPSGAGAKLGMPRSTLESKIRSLKINKNRFKA